MITSWLVPIWQNYVKSIFKYFESSFHCIPRLDQSVWTILEFCIYIETNGLP